MRPHRHLKPESDQEPDGEGPGAWGLGLQSASCRELGWRGLNSCSTLYCSSVVCLWAKEACLPGQWVGQLSVNKRPSPCVWWGGERQQSTESWPAH